MRAGYILLHRKGITEQDWKHAARTLAWIDLCTLAAFRDHVTQDGATIRRGEVVASFSYLAKRWNVAKSTAYAWISYFVAERQLERRSERCHERNAERFFLVNYAKYQMLTERSAEREVARIAERTSELIKLIIRIPVSRIPQQNVFASPPAPRKTKAKSPKPLPEHLVALAVFTVGIQMRFDNPGQLNAWIDRNKKTSKALKDFTPRQVATACVYAGYERDQYVKKHGGPPYDIHLETVQKKIFEHKDDQPGGSHERAIRTILDFYEKNANIILSQKSPYIRPQ